MRRSTELTQYRIKEISALDLGKVLGLFAVLSAVVGALIHGAQDRYFDLRDGVLAVAVSGLGGFVGGVVAATLYNIVGGVRVMMAPVAEETPPATAGGDSEPEDLLQPSAGTHARKQCPGCGAKVRADRSFCPECDHSFDDD